MSLAWVIIVVMPVVGIGVFCKPHTLPKKIAEKRHHPQKDAIQTLDDQQTAGVSFTAKQQQWLEANKGPISSRLAIDTEDFANIPFNQLCGLVRAYELFGDPPTSILEELNARLAA